MSLLISIYAAHSKRDTRDAAEMAKEKREWGEEPHRTLDYGAIQHPTIAGGHNCLGKKGGEREEARQLSLFAALLSSTDASAMLCVTWSCTFTLAVPYLAASSLS